MKDGTPAERCLERFPLGWNRSSDQKPLRSCWILSRSSLAVPSASLGHAEYGRRPNWRVPDGCARAGEAAGFEFRSVSIVSMARATEDVSMKKSRKRFFEISPGWPGASPVSLLTDDWPLGPLANGISFADLEARYGKPIPSSGQFMFKRPKSLPDYVWATGAVPIVTSVFKSVVETLAPGEAEFQPFTMRWPDGEIIAGQWFLMNVPNLVDCFDYERMGHPRPATSTHRPTGEAMSEDEIWLQMRLNQAYSFHPIYIRPDAAGLLHIWRPFFQSHLVFCTDDLVKALKSAGVKRLHAERIGTRDDPLKEHDWAALGVRLPGT